MKVALIAVSVLAGLFGVALVTLVLGGSSATIGDQREFENEGDAPAPQEDGPTRRVKTEINDGSGWKDVDLEVTLLRARTANPSRDKTLGIEEPGHRWIAARFAVHNRADDQTDDSPALTAVDTEGQTHEAGGFGVMTPSLEQLSVPAGGRRTGYLSVQVPDDAKIERLEASFIGETLGWDLDRPL